MLTASTMNRIIREVTLNEPQVNIDSAEEVQFRISIIQDAQKFKAKGWHMDMANDFDDFEEAE